MRHHDLPQPIVEAGEEFAFLVGRAADGVIAEWPTSATTTYELVLVLLGAWSGRPSGQVPHLTDDVDLWGSWSALVQRVVDRFDDHRGLVDEADLLWLAETFDAHGDQYDWAHAVAWGLDVATWMNFTAVWRVLLGGVELYSLEEGDVYPVTDWIQDRPAGSSYSVRPGAEPVGLDELPHVRRWTSQTAPGSASVDVVFRFDAFPEVDAAAESAVAATIHPNGNVLEFEMVGTTAIFPVRPKPPDQADRIERLLELAADHAVGFVVGGEVSLTEAVLDRAQQWLDNSWNGPALLVAGSLHSMTDGEPSNVALALRAEKPALLHRKIVPFEVATSETSAPKREGIVPGPRTLQVWVGGWARFSMLICRDLLDAGLRSAAIRAGVNLLAVPVFSDETSSYPVHVGSVSLGTQGRVVVANNPTSHENGRVDPTAVFGQPIKNRSAQPLNCAPDDGAGSRGLGLDTLGAQPEWIETH